MTYRHAASGEGVPHVEGIPQQQRSGRVYGRSGHELVLHAADAARPHRLQERLPQLLRYLHSSDLAVSRHALRPEQANPTYAGVQYRRTQLIVARIQEHDTMQYLGRPRGKRSPVQRAWQHSHTARLPCTPHMALQRGVKAESPHLVGYMAGEVL